MTLSVAYTIQCHITGQLVNNEWCVKKQWWSDLRYNFDICLINLRKNMINLCHNKPAIGL